MGKRKTSDSPSHSFIVRIWKEQREFSDSPSEWRGVIEHIPGGEKLYFQQFEEIIPFLQVFINTKNQSTG